MFTKATQAEVEELAAFSWAIQSNIETASYPMEPFQSQRDMADTLCRYLKGNPKHPDDTVLVLRADGKPVAAVILDVERDARTLHTGGIYAAGNVLEAYTKLKAWCRRVYAGYTLDIGLPGENRAGIQAAVDIGGELREHSEFFRLEPQDFVPFQGDFDIRLLDLAAYDAFAAYADRAVPPDELYWNAERIRTRFDLWRIHTLYADGEVAGCAAMMKYDAALPPLAMSEIFRCDVLPAFRSPEALRALLTHAAEAAFADGKRYILCSVEITEDPQREAALQSGFKRIGSYRNYTVLCS